MNEATGRKEDIAQAVVIAALTSLVSGLVNWGVEEAKRAIEKRRELNSKLREFNSIHRELSEPDLQKQGGGKAE